MSNQKKPPTHKSSDTEDEHNETTSIELISTQVLKTLLAEETDALDILQMTASADAVEDSVLARDDDGNFELLEKSSLESLMNTPVRRTVSPASPRGRQPEAPSPGPRTNDVPVPKINLEVSDSIDELELVNTTMLRIILDEKLQEEGKAPKFAMEAEDAERAAKGRADKHGGFNPYDSSKKLRR
ncbi:MAG: hypothetical protein AAF385_12845 [Pseudomonadota bacterium]